MHTNCCLVSHLRVDSWAKGGRARVSRKAGKVTCTHKGKPASGAGIDFLTGIKAPRDDDESRRDSAFEHAEDNAAGHHTSIIEASGMERQCYAPQEHTHCEVAAQLDLLEYNGMNRQSKDIANVEDGSEPRVLRGIEMQVILEVQEVRVVDGGLVQEGEQVHAAHQWHQAPVQLSQYGSVFLRCGVEPLCVEHLGDVAGVDMAQVGEQNTWFGVLCRRVLLPGE